MWDIHAIGQHSFDSKLAALHIALRWDYYVQSPRTRTTVNFSEVYCICERDIYVVLLIDLVISFSRSIYNILYQSVRGGISKSIT